MMHLYASHNTFIGDSLDREPSLYRDDVSFDIKNRERKQAILNRVNFVRTILEEHDYEKAYAMLFPVETNAETTSVFSKS